MALDFRPGWLQDLENESEPLLEHVGELVRDRARSNARHIGSDDVEAIVSTESDSDHEGPYVDVGYDRHHPGFVLWWHEVGTSQFPPEPHLRPAASGKII